MNHAKNVRLHTLMLGAGLLLASAGANAQATRTWVSGVGDDANPCSRTAPCKTFAGAISKTATDGIISVLDPGGFGTVTITKGITIDGGGIEASILASGATGVTVNAPATAVVTLRNLRISGNLGTGINGVRFLNGSALHIERCIIESFRSTAANAGFGILVNPTTAGARRLYVSDTIVQDSGSSTTGGGMNVVPTGGGFVHTVIKNSHFVNNLGHGLRLADNTHTTVENTNISGNRKSGIFATASSGLNITEVVARYNTITDSGTDPGFAALVASGATAFINIANNVIANNELALTTISGGNIRSFGDNQVLNNTTNGAPTATINEL
jgi:hypothetical protein